MTSTVASVLTVPVRQLYALLWRVGVVEIVETDRMSCRAPEPAPAGGGGHSRAVG
nr:Rv1535 domain-containing protein [Mycobacterium sp. IS-1264]